ncbi:hypothetical protein V2J09_021232 [Rumex salicifolius]
MVDFSCYTPPATCRVPRATFMEHVSTMGIFDADSVALVERVTASSGTCLPLALFYIPPKPHHKESIQAALPGRGRPPLQGRAVSPERQRRVHCTLALVDASEPVRDEG